MENPGIYGGNAVIKTATQLKVKIRNMSGGDSLKAQTLEQKMREMQIK